MAPARWKCAGMAAKISCSQTTRNHIVFMISLAGIVLPAKSAHLLALYMYVRSACEGKSGTSSAALSFTGKLVKAGSGSAYCTWFSEARYVIAIGNLP